MGVYLNSRSAYSLFCEDYALTYYVDKTDILAELVPIVELVKNLLERSGSNRGRGQKYVAITRPRRFGKTVMANMIASYFGKGADSAAELTMLRMVLRNLPIPSLARRVKACKQSFLRTRHIPAVRN